MDTIYWVSLLVGGFFILLSIFGGAFDSDADADLDFDADADFDADFDADVDYDFDLHGADFDGGGPDFVDLFSIRALFLFAAFFGLTGVLLGLAGSAEPFRGISAALMGLLVGLGGNYFIKRVGYAHVSSDITGNDLHGRTGKVLIPFEGDERGKITLEAKGHRLQLMARAFEGEGGPYEPGDEVVVVRRDGSTVEVVKPN